MRSRGEKTDILFAYRKPFTGWSVGDNKFGNLTLVIVYHKGYM